MKTMKHIVTIIALVCMNCTYAQETPTPPPTPETPSNSGSSTYKSRSRGNGSSSSHSISVKNDNLSYRFRASFSKDLSSKIQTYLVKELGKKNLNNSKTYSLWKIEKNDETAFSCKLHKGSLKIYLDKEAFSEKFQQQILTMGNQLKYMISGRDPMEAKKRDLERAQRRLKQAEKALKRAQKRVNDY
ncbi:hypothetical protein RQM59_08485 [Flavobacteriaceae bacterium S356]|uniref:Uncharacterized protein n=1 Tax=Asprobacillus argus TaxID=3076534 RepID=A0ABU3LFA6_9FLAO|nr:hypothetical protein [Flavobacteriaceae bacterium S356]